MSFLKGIEEICPSTQRRHKQCAVYTESAYTFNSFYKKINSPEVRIKGFLQPCIDWEKLLIYCTLGKGRTPPDTSGVPGSEFSIGVPPAQGTRSDFAAQCAIAVASGISSCSDVAIARYSRGLAALRLYRLKPKIQSKLVVWRYGPTQTGKTEMVFAEVENKSFYMQSNRNGFFDGYDGEEVVILDEFEKGVFTEREILSLFHKFPTRFNCKFGTLPAVHTTVYVTSHQHPMFYFPPDRYEEVRRRITHLWMHTPNSSPVEVG